MRNSKRDCICLCEYERTFAAEIEGLAAMGCHNQEARRNAQPVNPNLPFVHRLQDRKKNGKVRVLCVIFPLLFTSEDNVSTLSSRTKMNWR